MINKKFIQKLKQDFDKNNQERRQIISMSNAVLHDSKRAIFSLHRGDKENTQKLLKEIEFTLIKSEKKFGYNRLNTEGSYRAAVEEYVEAKMFFSLTTENKLDKIKSIKLDTESYLGGICDLTGELVRQAINSVSQGRLDRVEEIKKNINDIMAELVEFDMRGYLRTKYDQAKSSLKKIEQIDYEIKLRK